MTELINGFTGFAQKRADGVNHPVADAHLPEHDAQRAEKGAPFRASEAQAVQSDMRGGGAGIAGGTAREAFGTRVRGGAPTRGSLRFDPDALRAIPESDRRWAWAEVDLNAIVHNMQMARATAASGVRIMAVVKGDAFGHGIVRVAKTAVNTGADYLGVGTIDEAITLREALVNAPILLLDQPPISAIPLLLGYKVMPSVYTTDFVIQYGELADLYGVEAPYHFVINTGLNRMGVRYDEAAEFLRQISFHRALQLRGVFTHFATADSSDSVELNKQMRRFIDALTAIHAAGIDPGIVHCANTAAAARYPDTQLHMVRWGQGLYGLQPCIETRRTLDLRPAMSIHARISDVRMLPMSEGISLGLNYRSVGSAKACTIPLGYADGLVGRLSGRMDVLHSGIRCRQVGDICMSHCMFEVDMRSHAARMRSNPQVGDEVIIVGRQGDQIITMTDLAQAASIPAAELTCAFGAHLPRAYVL